MEAPSSTQSGLYRAPFAADGAAPVDVAIAEKLLAVALSRGGDYADLFFEYRAAGGFVFDEGILKRASRGVSMGLGVRVQKGDATGYAYVEQLDWDAMKRAAETAAQIASGGGSKAPIAASRSELPRRYELQTVTLDVPGLDKRQLLERAAAAAHAFDPRVVKVEASLAEEIREILVVTSDGTMARDTQPLVRFGVRVIAEKDGKRQEGSSGGGGRTSLGYFEGQEPRVARPRGGAPGDHDARRGRMRRPGRWRSCSRRATAASCCTRPSGHGLEADFNRKGTSNYSGKVGEDVAERAVHRRRRRDAPPEPRHHQRGRRGQRAAEHDAHREGKARRLHARSPEREALRSSPERKRAPRELRLRADAADDQHHPPRRDRTIPRRSSGASSAASTRRSSAAARSTSPTATSSSR